MTISAELTVVITRHDGTRIVTGSEVLTDGGTGSDSHLGNEIASAIAAVLERYTSEHALVLRPAPGSKAWATDSGLVPPVHPRNEPPAWLAATRAWIKARMAS